MVKENTIKWIVGIIISAMIGLVSFGFGLPVQSLTSRQDKVEARQIRTEDSISKLQSEVATKHDIDRVINKIDTIDDKLDDTRLIISAIRGKPK